MSANRIALIDFKGGPLDTAQPGRYVLLNDLFNVTDEMRSTIDTAASMTAERKAGALVVVEFLEKQFIDLARARTS